MNRDRTSTRPWYFWPLSALLVGILIGLIIGWGIWPVKWTNAYPQDLRAAERNEYLAMVAESYAANPNVELAQARLATWSAADLAQAMAGLQEVASNTDAKRAEDVQLLSKALNLESVAPAPAAAPAPTSGVTQPTGALAILKRVCSAVLWIALALGAVALFVWLFRKWRSYQQGTTEPSGSGLQRYTTRDDESGRSTADIVEDAKAQWPSERVDVREPLPAAGWSRPSSYTREPEPQDDVARAADLPPFMTQREEPSTAAVRPQTVEPRREPVAETVKRIPPQPASAAPARLGDFIAVYQGEDGYDEAFDINDPVDGYLGQCGLQLNDPVGRARDQAIALQAWLWDSTDPDTRVKVLMSEGGYRDTGLRSEQAGEHEAIPVRSGTEFTLETHDLLLRGLVERITYSEQEPARVAFSELQVKFQAFRKR